LLIQLICVTPWFQVWYLLWTLPLLGLWLPLYGSVILTFFLVALGYGTGAFIGSSLSVLAFLYVLVTLRSRNSLLPSFTKQRTTPVEKPRQTR
jgi:hypothetical protein